MLLRKKNQRILLPLFPHQPENVILAGVDEVGRGALAGPVVAAAVILPHANLTHQLNDSKKISPKRREEIFHELSSKAEIGVGIVPHTVIDSINILQATLLAMKEAISQLKVKPNLVLIDGKFVPRIDLECQAIIDGDALVPCISAASIVAKVTRDRMMIELDRTYPDYGFARHKGYGTRQHMKALQSYGPTDIHRRSFSPLKGIICKNVQG